MRGLRAGLHARSAEYWRQLATLLFSLLAGTKAVLSFDSGHISPWQVAAIALLVIVAGQAHRHIWHEELKRSPVAAGLPEDLVDANLRWVSEPGRMVIVTRDMSWSMAGGVADALHKKAERGEITVFAWESTAALISLKSAGAQVNIMTGSPPTVRFTVLRWGTSDERVLVHRQARGRVEFYEVSSVDFPAFWLAQDLLVQLRKAVAGPGS